MSMLLRCAALLLALASPIWAGEAETIVTRVGTLAVVPQPWNTRLHGIRLGEDTVLGGGYDVKLIARYELGAQDVVLVSDDGELELLVLEPGKEPRRLWDDRFFSRDHTRNVSLQDGRIEIDLGWDGGRRKRARYDGERLVFVFEVPGLPRWIEADSRFATRAGTLSVVANTDLPPTSVVKLGEETVFQAEQMYITLYGNYPLGPQDVVLIGTKSGGTCCPYDQLSLLVLESGKAPRVLSDDGFITIDGTQEPELEPTRLEVDLGFDGGKRKLARFDGRDLSIVVEDRGRPPLTEEDCGAVHEGMLQCADRRSDDPHCEDPARFWGVIGRSVIPILQQPGLDQRGFNAACVAACKSGEAPPLDAAFRESVCGIGSESSSSR